MFFGFSLAKLIVLVAIVALVWYGFKFLQRLDRVSGDAKGRPLRGGRPRASRRSDDEDDVETMVKCPKCGAYVPARSPTACERADCPYA